jgi:hypothetical protein
MTNDFQLIVHFSCPHCTTIHAASQEEQPQECSGEFYCGRCGAPVDEWIGIYDYCYWEACDPYCEEYPLHPEMVGLTASRGSVFATTAPALTRTMKVAGIMTHGGSVHTTRLQTYL